MSSPVQEIHLLVERLYPTVQRVDSASPGVAIGAKLIGLVLEPAPRLLAVEPDGCPVLREAVAGLGNGLVLEPFTNPQRQPRLLAVKLEGEPLRVNGQPAPRLAVLKEKDMISWTEEFALYVTIYNRPGIGTPSGDVLGRECAVCGVPFSGETKCYTCVCGLAMHCEDDAKEGLQCVQLRADCPACRRPVVLTEGYGYYPEAVHV